MKIVGVSDVSIGYGSPEVPALMNSVCTLFNARGTLIEPDEITRPPIVFDGTVNFDLKRMHSIADDGTRAWFSHYIASAAEEINRGSIDLLVLFGPAVSFLLPLLRKWPKRILYHNYELITALPQTIALHKTYMDRIDLMTFPEVDRLIIDLERIGKSPKNTAGLLNCADISFPGKVRTLGASERNGCFLFYGTLNRHTVLTDYFWHPSIKPFSIDIFGRITEPDQTPIIQGLQSNPNCRYEGVLPAAELNARRQNYAWSLVWWNPKISAGHYFLAPNRLFTSIQAHVPPICGPHPQCINIINRFDCGILMKGWTVEDLEEALTRASAIYGTPRYEEMVRNCAEASKELNWDRQFERIRPALLDLQF